MVFSGNEPGTLPTQRANWANELKSKSQKSWYLFHPTLAWNAFPNKLIQYLTNQNNASNSLHNNKVSTLHPTHINLQTWACTFYGRKAKKSTFRENILITLPYGFINPNSPYILYQENTSLLEQDVSFQYFLLIYYVIKMNNFTFQG